MKKLLIIFSLLLPAIFFGQQTYIDSCGMNAEHQLNAHEAAYFNEILPGNFNFTDKKVAFKYGDFGKQNISKQTYFDRWGKEYYKSGKAITNQLLVLTPEEKSASGGFDAVIVTWSKPKLQVQHRKRMVRNLKKIS